MGPEWAGAAQQPADVLAAQLRDDADAATVSPACSIPARDSTTRLALRKRIESGEVPGPRVLTAGEPLFPPDGIPIYLRDLPPEMLRLMKEPATPNEAIEAVDTNIERGADAVKLFTGAIMGGGVGEADAAAVVARRCRRGARLGRPVFAHPSNAEGATIAVEAGVDVLAHTNSQGWTQALVDSMLAHRTALVPTLKLWPYEAAKEHASAAESDAFTAEAIAELTAFVRGGGETLFGTDVGYMRDFDPTDEYRADGARRHDADADPRGAHHRAGAALPDRSCDRARRGRLCRGSGGAGGRSAQDVRRVCPTCATRMRDGRLIYARKTAH